MNNNLINPAINVTPLLPIAIGMERGGLALASPSGRLVGQTGEMFSGEFKKTQSEYPW